MKGFTIQLLILPLSPYSLIIIYRLKINAGRGQSERSLHFNTYRYSERFGAFTYNAHSFFFFRLTLRSTLRS